MQTVKDSRDIKTFEGFLKAWENFHPPKGLALTPFAVEHFRSEREAKRKKAGREAKKRSRSKTG